MQVLLLDFTGNRAPNPARAAAEILVYAKSTRLKQGEELQDRIVGMSDDDLSAELDAIALSIRSSWEFVDYTFQVLDVSRVCTHQLVRHRLWSFAQQAMRVADMTDFEVLTPPTIEDDAERSATWATSINAIREAYHRLRELNVPAEDARGILPQNVLTNIMGKVNLRALADAVGKRNSLRVQGEMVSVIRAMADRVMEVHPWTEKFLFPDRSKTPALDAILKEALNGRPPVEMPHVNDGLKELDRLKGTWG